MTRLSIDPLGNASELAIFEPAAASHGRPRKAGPLALHVDHVQAVLAEVA